MSTTVPMRLNGGQHGGSFRKSKTGAIVHTVPWEVYSLEDCESFIPSPPPLGLPITDRNASESETGSWILMLTYEGLVGEGTTDPDDDANALDLELDGSMSQDTLKSNPNWKKIAAKFGWNSTAEEFPEDMPKSGSGTPARNLLHGSDSYLAVGAIFRCSFVSRTVPDSVLAKVGEIFAIPPQFNHLGIRQIAGRNWLKLTPKIDRRGNAAHVTLEYMMSGPNGWVRDVYNFSQLRTTGSGDAAGSGLHSGSLSTGGL
ncbi:MAG: hypothetical protein ABMA13_20630 [Chthoniobacteraceae bacterium]